MAYTKRADGRYQTRIYLGKIDGVKQYKYLYANNINDLRRIESEFRQKHLIGVDLLTIEDSYYDWLNRLKAIKEVETSESEYKTWLSRAGYFIPDLGSMQLKSIKQSHIQSIVNDLFKENPSTGNPTARRTLQRYVKACSDVFEYAIENRSTDFNPCKYIKIPKQAAKGQRRALTEEEQRWIREYSHRAQLPAMIMLYSGLRKGELTALTWNDIDLENHTITVNKSYDFKSDELKPPKTESGNRIVSIPQILVNYLSTVERKGIYVVTNDNGQMMTDTGWRHLWDRYMIGLDNKYGVRTENMPIQSSKTKRHIFVIDTFTPHCLRHTFCTLMYNAGVDVITCQQQLGHSEVKTTLQIYTHLDALNKKKNIGKLDLFLSEGVSTGVSKIL